MSSELFCTFHRQGPCSTVFYFSSARALQHCFLLSIYEAMQHFLVTAAERIRKPTMKFKKNIFPSFADWWEQISGYHCGPSQTSPQLYLRNIYTGNTQTQYSWFLSMAYWLYTVYTVQYRTVTLLLTPCIQTDYTITLYRDSATIFLTGKNSFTKYFVFAKKFAKNLGPRSLWLRWHYVR